MDSKFLLQTYGQCYDSGAGPWNLSLANKYLEYMFTKFFEENFDVAEGDNICNIGIGAGYWDRYLSYRLKGGCLTSIDIDKLSCRQLRECLINEKNPNKINIINSDIMLVENMERQFEIVTMVGSTCLEIGLYDSVFEKVFSLLKKDGTLYYQTLDKNEQKEDFSSVCKQHGMEIINYLYDNSYGFKAQYWKVRKKFSYKPLLESPI